MKNLFRVVVLLAVAGNACAVEPPPVLLVVLTDMGAKNQADGSAGLLVFAIGAWANHSVNKQSARKVESYMRVLGMPDFLSQWRRAARPGAAIWLESGTAPSERLEIPGPPAKRASKRSSQRFFGVRP